MTNAPDAFVARATNLPASHPAIAMSVTGTRTLDDGTPVEFLWKPCIKVGDYEHPKLGKLSFTRDYLADVDRNTRQFIQDGGKPYVPLGHSNKTNLGWIRETKFDGETLFGLHEMIGQDAILAAKRNDSSVCIRNNYVGGNGRKYGPLLEHNCLTPEPVAMGLGGFVALSRDASGLSSDAPIFIPAAERNPLMPTADELAMARDLLGKSESDLPDDKVFGMLLEAASTASRYAGEAEEATLQLSRATEELAETKTKLATQMVEMSRATTPQRPSASELYWACRAVLAERNKSVGSGAITPAVADKAEQRYLKKPVKFDTVTLSREVEDDDHKIAAGLANLMDFYETVQGNVPTPKTGEVTGAQLIEFARTEPGTGNPPAQTRTNPYAGEIEAQKAAATAKAS